MRLGPGRASGGAGRAPVARRDALRLGGLALGGLALAGCSDGPDPSPREGDLVLLDVADDDGAPLDLEGLRQIQSNGAGEDGWDDQLLDADTLRVVTHAPLEESEEATCQLRVPAGRACALTLSWPTSHGYSALVADIPGPGRHALAELAARSLHERLVGLARAGADVPMLAHTHGQPATPVTMGKEMAVFAHRFGRQIARVGATEYLGKINGATGTWAAHVVGVPGADWPAVSRSFVEGLGLAWNPLTTQIESHDWQAELYADMARAGRVAHNLATDCWTYISMGYFHQNLAAQGSTGSSTMPHKVNPIRFENAEANLEVSAALLDSLAATLVTSRMQRDLTDSTTQRNIGVAIGHAVLAYDNLVRGLDGVDMDAERMAADLDANWAVLGEAVQQAMRAAAIAGATGMANPYERLKELTRGHEVGAAEMRDFIAGLGLPAEVEERLLALTPAAYVGLSSRLAHWEH